MVMLDPFMDFKRMKTTFQPAILDYIPKGSLVNNGRLADVMGHVVRSYFVISIFLGDQTLVVLAQYIFSESLTRCSPELSNSCNTKIKVP